MRQWLKRQRLRLAWFVGLLTAIALVSTVGGFLPLDRLFLGALFQLRGDRATSQRVVVVTLEEGRQHRMADVLERVRRQGPDVALVEVRSGRDLAAVPCSDAFVYHGERRPDELPEPCAWVSEPEEVRTWTDVPLLTPGGQRTVAGMTVERVTGETVRRPDITVNLSGSMPTVAATALGDAGSGLFSGRVVVVQTDDAAVVETPYGWISRAQLRAEAVASALEDASIRSSPGLAAIITFLFALLGAFVAGRSKPLNWLVPAAAVGLLFHYLCFTLLEFNAGGPVSFVAMVGGLLVFGNVPADRKEAGREVRLRLAAAVKESMQRGAHRIATDRRFWPMLMQRVAAELDAPSMALAERPPESWWIVYRSFHDMTEDDIDERRRDIRRMPYRDAHETHTIATTAGYVTDSEHDSILVPLVNGSEVCGFWLINHPTPDAFLDEHRKLIERMAQQLGSEVRAFQLEQHARQIDERFEGRGDDIVDASLSAMENLERERRVMEDVLSNSRIGLMMTNLFGEISYENPVMRDLLADVDIDPGADIVAFFCQLTGLEEEEAKRRLDAVIETGELVSVTVSVGEGEAQRVLDIRIGPAQRQTGGREVVQGLVLTAADITSVVESDRSRLQVVEVINTRAADLLNVLAGYTSVLAMSENVESAERALVEGLQHALGEFEGLVRDFDQVAGKGTERAPQDVMPLSVQYAVREALRGARDVADLPRVRFDIPDHPMVARGHPETVQNAIRLLILDAVDLSPEEVGVDISVEERDDGMVIHVAVPDVAIPNDLLQRMLQEPTGEAEPGQNRLFKASNYVQAGGGKLVASSSLAEGLHFKIILPRND